MIENNEDYPGFRPWPFVTDRCKLTVSPGEDYSALFNLETNPDGLHNR